MKKNVTMGTVPIVTLSSAGFSQHLFLVHKLVGFCEEVVEGGAARVLGDVITDAHIHGEGELSFCVYDAKIALQPGLDIRLDGLSDDDEFVAAEAHLEVALSAGSFYDFGQGADREVAEFVAELVVDVLHIVDVEEEDAELSALLLDAAEELICVFVVSEAVVESGERIRDGKRGQLVVEL